jgi:hypothetical protein
MFLTVRTPTERWHALWAVMILVGGRALTASPGAVPEARSGRENTVVCKAGGPLCGIYCLYASMRFCGKQIDARDLVSPAYIGSYRGSSIKQLQDAAEDYGMYAFPVCQLTPAELRQLRHYQAILHVKSKAESRVYDHCILFLGADGTKARIFNPPERIRPREFRELVPLWDGTALILSPKPFDVTALRAHAENVFLARLAFVVSVVAALRAMRGTRIVKDAASENTTVSGPFSGEISVSTAAERS